MFDSNSDGGPKYDDLVGFRPYFEYQHRKCAYGLSLNLSPNHKVDMKALDSSLKKSNFVRWELLTPEQQIKFLTILLKRYLVKECDMFEAGYEFTDKGMIHGHVLVCINDDIDYKQWHLQTLRSRLNGLFMSCPILKRGHGDDVKKLIRIHEVDKKEYNGYTGTRGWYEYIHKDIGKVHYHTYKWMAPVSV